jgi:hypothetical protein
VGGGAFGGRPSFVPQSFPHDHELWFTVFLPDQEF